MRKQTLVLFLASILCAGWLSDSRASRLPASADVSPRPPEDKAPAPVWLADLEETVQALNRTIGRYPPRVADAAQRETEHRKWERALSSALTLPPDKEPERRLALLAELYRQGHNLGVAGSAAKADRALEECLQRFPQSAACHLSASFFYLSVAPTAESRAAAETSLAALRRLARPRLNEDAEAGYVFFYLHASQPDLALQQLERYLRAFPSGPRSEDFRAMRKDWDKAHVRIRQPRSAATADPTLNAPAVLGTWRVSDHRSPGVSAMPRSEADRWIGRKALYGESHAGFADTACDTPSYKRSTISHDHFETDFKVKVAELSMTATPVSLVEVECKGAKWVAPGALLIEAGKNRMWTLWDGVFFELRRDSTRERQNG